MEANYELIRNIVALEWTMFDSVNDGYARASCQDDYDTFTGMRFAQFSAWDLSSLSSYLDDLNLAVSSNRNLVTEKYIHMMKTTEPSKFDALSSMIPVPSDTVTTLSKEISDTLIEQTRTLFEQFPFVAGAGRPLYSAQDFCGVISVETYQYSELLTFSENTLSSLKNHILNLKKQGISLARVILENSIRFYGYQSLENAESAAERQANMSSIDVSFGCPRCDW